MSSGVKNVLGALIYLRDVKGLEEAPKESVLVMSKVSKATFPSLISRMVKKELIEYGSTKSYLMITALGEGQAEPLDLPTSDEEHHEEIKKELKGKALQIFEILADGKVHKKFDIMGAIDCKNPSTFAPLVSRNFAKKGYIKYPSKDTMQLTDECFPFSRGNNNA